LFGECTKDTDCKGDRICEKGKCIYPVGGNQKNESPSWKEPKKNDAQNRKMMELYQELVKAKKARKGNIVGMSLGFGLGVNFVVGGGILLRVEPITASILMAGGGIEIILGFVSAGLYVRNNRRVHKYSKEYEAISGVIFENKKISINIPKPIVFKNHNGEYYGLSMGFSL